MVIKSWNQACHPLCCRCTANAYLHFEREGNNCRIYSLVILKRMITLDGHTQLLNEQDTTSFPKCLLHERIHLLDQTMEWMHQTTLHYADLTPEEQKDIPIPSTFSCNNLAQIRKKLFSAIPKYQQVIGPLWRHITLCTTCRQSSTRGGAAVQPQTMGLLCSSTRG